MLFHLTFSIPCLKKFTFKMERFSLTENITQQYLILHLLEFNNGIIQPIVALQTITIANTYDDSPFAICILGLISQKVERNHWRLFHFYPLICRITIGKTWVSGYDSNGQTLKLSGGFFTHTSLATESKTEFSSMKTLHVASLCPCFCTIN